MTFAYSWSEERSDIVYVLFTEEILTIDKMKYFNTKRDNK